MIMWIMALVIVLVGYALGNLNGAILASHIIAHEDVRDHGSGNAGLTNFIRNYGVQNTLLVFLIDGGKAVLSCLIGGWLLSAYGLGLEGRMLGGLAGIFGHVFPAVYKFKGGKGVLSGFFVAMAVDWRVALIILAVFAVAYGLTMYVSLGSVLAAAAFAIGFVCLHFGNWPMMLCGTVAGVLVIVMHYTNIQRLVKGEERKTNLFARGRGK
jgi:glycerol-3-phosphate acyltransferase PlsY